MFNRIKYIIDFLFVKTILFILFFDFPSSCRWSGHGDNFILEKLVILQKSRCLIKRSGYIFSRDSVRNSSISEREPN